MDRVMTSEEGRIARVIRDRLEDTDESRITRTTVAEVVSTYGGCLVRTYDAALSLHRRTGFFDVTVPVNLECYCQDCRHYHSEITFYGIRADLEGLLG